MGVPASSEEVTQLLLAWGQGADSALERLTPLVYDELHRLARQYMAGERRQVTMQATALVNEAYLRLTDSKRVQWQNRAHFLAIAAQLMRRILVDYARSRRSRKRGGDIQQVSLNEAQVVSQDKRGDLLALDEALKSLAKIDKRKSEMVELRFFGGLSVKETAVILNVSEDTVHRDWRLAKAWLLHELKQSEGSDGS